MKKELQERIFRAYPNLYADVGLPPNQTAMYWGLDCGDGWFELIDKLSKRIEAIIVEQKLNEPPNICRALQIKEKYGELRFYMTSATDEIYNLLDEAEVMSREICEICGKPGRVQNRYGWVKTLCDKCNDRWQKGANYNP